MVESGTPTITIPDTYSSCGQEGGDRPPYDLSLIEVLNAGTRNVWLYDRTGWADIANLGLTDECPLSSRGAHGLAAVLATEIDGPQGFIPDTVRASAAAFLRSLSYKGGSEHPVVAGVYF